ncbi:MAG: hypothetical protein Q8Q39_00925 [bacterium]|nr:hypothetical protein [bacterium]
MIPNPSQNVKHQWLWGFGILLIALAAALAVWWPYIITDKAMWHDWARVGQNMFLIAHEQLHAYGKFPTWTDSFFSGFPFTQSLNGLYNPVNILFIWMFDSYTAYHAVLVANFVMGFIAAFAFGRLIALSRAASIILAFGHTYTQWNITWAHNNMYANLLLLPPLLFGAVYKSRQGFSWLWTLLAVYATTTGVISATPDSAVWVIMAAGVFALYLDWKAVGFPKRISAIRTYKATLTFCGIAAFSALIAIFFLLPSLRLADLTFRSGGLSLIDAAPVGISIGDILLLFSPHFPSLPYFLRSQPWIYVGAATLLCGVIGLWVRKSHPIGSIFSVMFVYLILANLQYSPFYGVARFFPGLNTQRGTFRTLFVAYFIFATLAAIGIHALQTESVSDAAKRQLLKISQRVLLWIGAFWISLTLIFHSGPGYVLQEWGLHLLRAVRANPKPLEHYQTVWSGISDQIAKTVWLGDIRFLGAIGAIFALWLILRLWERESVTPSYAAAIIAIIGGLNLMLVWQHYHVEVPRTLVTQRSATVQFLDTIRPHEPFRVFTASGDGLAPAEYNHEPYMRLANEALIPNAHMLFGYESIFGNEGIRPRRINELLSSFGSTYAPLPGEKTFNRITDEARKNLLTKYQGTLSMMNVRYLFTTYQLKSPWKYLHETYLPDTETTIRIYENTAVLPRAYFPKQISFIPIDEVATLPVVLANKDFSEKSIIECRDCPTGRTIAFAGDGKADIIEHRDDGLLRIRTKTDEPRWLIASQHNLPGWRITIDGKEVTGFRANYIYFGILVPQGEHLVEMSFPGAWDQFIDALLYYLDPARAWEKDLPRLPRPAWGFS